MTTTGHTRRTRIRTAVLAVAAAVALLTAMAVPADATPPRPAGSMCDTSWADLGPSNPLASVRDGIYGVPGLPSLKVGEDGDVNWEADPLDDLTWRVWLTSMNWLGPLVDSYRATGDRSDLDLAVAYAHDYVQDEPLSTATKDEPVLQSTGHRMNFFSCLYEVAPSPWLADAIDGTAQFLMKNWAGLFNHGQQQDIGLITAGCVLGRQDWVDYARDRLGGTLAVSIDSQGATNEQSASYAYYSMRRWEFTAHELETCGQPPLAGLSEKLALARVFVASATRPDGLLVPFGDTPLGTPGITGETGLPLSNAWTIGGYAFGRSSWSASDDPSYYSLRFGPGRAVHGGPDHGSVTLYAHGSPIVTEPGSIGYTHANWPWFRWSPEAHNVLLAGTGRCAVTKPADLVSSKRRAAYDTYVVSSPTCGPTIATRGVAFTRATGSLVVTDTTTAAPRRQTFQQLWHLTPGTVVSTGWTDRRTVLRISVRMPDGNRATFRVSSPRRLPFTLQVVEGQTSPYQGWVSGGLNNPVAAPVLAIVQRDRAASLRTTIDTH